MDRSGDMTRYVAGPALPEDVKLSGVGDDWWFSCTTRSSKAQFTDMALAAGWIVEEEPVPTFEEVLLTYSDVIRKGLILAAGGMALLPVWDAGIAELREKRGA